MANQDRVNFVWAESALTTIPPIPVSEVAYRDTTQTPEQMEVGQQYDTIYNSARHNQLLFLLTSVAKTLCENGIMPFLAGQEYSQYARCIFTDGKLYTASRAIPANEQPYPTPGDDSGVWTTEETGDNFVPDSRRVIAGTGLTGGGPLSADVKLAVKLTNSVNLTDSTKAASATAVKTAYDLAKSKQPNLGFTPVQQGGGTGQDNSKIYIGHGTNGLKAQIGTTDLGYIVTTAAGTTKAANSASADRAQVAGSAETLFVKGWGNTKWGSTPYEQSPLYVWCSPSGGSDIEPCSPSVLSVGAANWSVYTPNVAVGDNSAVPKGGTWKYFSWGYDAAANGVVAGGTNISNRFIAIRVS